MDSVLSRGSMALWTLTGIFYLLLIAFLFLKVKKIDRLRFLYFFILVDLRMELYMLVGVIIQKNMIKAVIY